MKDQAISIRGEEFVALAQKALFWPAQSTLFVADVHLGKAAAFRARSIPLPHGTTEAALARLSDVIWSTQASTVVVLGDLWHDRLGRSESLLGRVQEWTESHSSVEFVLITGNHDQRAGKTPRHVGFREIDEICLRGFCGVHHPTPRSDAYVLSGHLHPGFTVSAARTSIRLPCFWFGPEVAILPAFGEFTGLAGIEAGPSDQVLVVAEDQVIPIRPDCF